MSANRARRLRERSKYPSEPTPRFYLESSALLAGLLEDDAELTRTIRPSLTSLSVLTLAEARRAVQRALAGNRIDANEATAALATIVQLETDCTLIEISDDILARVGRRFPKEPIRTLDAVHLASAELLDDPTAPVTILTRDQRIRENAELLGMLVG